MQYGITDKWEIDGQIVYQENYIKQAGLKAHSDGLGDSYAFLRYCAIEESDMLPHMFRGLVGQAREFRYLLLIKEH